MITIGSAFIDPDRPQVIHLRGEIDMDTAHIVNEAVLRVLADDGDASEVIVDLAHLSFIDSVGLSALVTASHEAAALGRRLVLRDVPPRTAGLFELTKLDEVLEIERREASAS